MIALDSTALIDIYKGDFGLVKVLENFEEDLLTTIVNYQEIIFGLNPENKKYMEEDYFYENLFKNLNVLNLSKESIKEASSIFWDLSANGDVIGVADCIIAGICLSNGVKKIITKNKKHFERIKGLEIISY